MCGIAGVFGRRDEVAVQRMLHAVRHRGPDAAGLWVAPDNEATLGHRRLSIIDTSERATQPMADASGRFHITFNGEIYNYRALRDNLRAAGLPFRTTSDTEVVLNAYRAWGAECLSRLDGMFAFAIVDTAPRPGYPRYFLARDRFGIKPLVWTRHGNVLWFASELRALLAGGVCTSEIEPHALRDFLAMGSVLQPRTMLRGVQCLEQGHYLSGDGEHYTSTRYYNLHDATCARRAELKDLDFASAMQGLRQHIDEAVAASMVADVEVGAFLSGGIDSSGLVALASGMSQRPLRTFALGFEGVGAADERVQARRVADIFGTRHEDVVVRTDDVSNMYDAALLAIDQPSVDGMNTWAVSQVASRHVKVALSGLGADEVFAGYSHFKILAADRFRLRHWNGFSKRVTERLCERVQHPYLHLYRFWRASDAERYGHLRRLVRDHERPRYHAPWSEPAGPWMQAHYPAHGIDADPVQSMSYTELHSYVCSTLLRDGDIMSMAHGLEVRPPFLHHPLVEYAYSLPGRLKLRGRRNKPALVAAFGERLPPFVAQRRKVGFELPLRAWLCGPLRSRVRDLLHTRNGSRLLTPAARMSLEHELQAGTVSGRALWANVVLLGWLHNHGLELPS